MTRADRRRRQRDAGAALRPADTTARTRTSAGARLPARGARARAAFEWLQLLTHPEIWAYDGATMGETMERCSTPSASAGSSSSPRTGSTSRSRPALRTCLACSRSPSSSPPPARRARRRCCARCARTASATCDSSAPTCRERSVGRHLCDAFHLVPAGSDPGFPDAMLRGRRAGGRRRRPAAVVVRPRGARRAREPVPRAGARLASRHDPPLERQGRDVRAPPPPRRAGAGVPARQRRARRSRRRRASSATPTGRSASSRSSRPGRAGSACSTRPSTARTSCCTSAPARSRCASRRRSSCCPTRAGPTCS